MDSLADAFYSKLEDSENPGNTLANFYSAVFNVPIGVQDIVMFNRLVSIYGKYSVFFSILDLFSFSDANIENNNVHGIISYYCKKRLERQDKSAAHYDDLEPLLEEMKKKIEKRREHPLKIQKLENKENG